MPPPGLLFPVGTARTLKALANPQAYLPQPKTLAKSEKRRNIPPENRCKLAKLPKPTAYKKVMRLALEQGY